MSQRAHANSACEPVGRVCLVLLFCVVFCTIRSCPAATLEAYLRGLGYGAIPLERGANNSLFVQTVADGKKLILLVDTGATLFSLDRRTAAKMQTVKELGIKLADPVLHQRIPEDSVLIRDLRLGTARFSNQPAEPVGLKPSGISYHGLLGCDFLIRQSAVLDCAGKCLFVRAGSLNKASAKALHQTLKSSGYHAAPLQRGPSLIPICEAIINKNRATLLVDTGSVFTMLDDDTANRCKMTWELMPNIRINGIGRRGGVKLSRGTPDTFLIAGASLRFPGLSIGACEMQSWDVGEGKAGPGLEKTDGVLGADLLGKSQALIDFGSNTLWFVPAEP